MDLNTLTMVFFVAGSALGLTGVALSGVYKISKWVERGLIILYGLSIITVFLAKLKIGQQ